MSVMLVDRLVRPSVGRSVSLSLFSEKGGKLQVRAPSGTLVYPPQMGNAEIINPLK